MRTATRVREGQPDSNREISGPGSSGFQPAVAPGLTRKDEAEAWLVITFVLEFVNNWRTVLTLGLSRPGALEEYWDETREQT